MDAAAPDLPLDPPSEVPMPALATCRRPAELYPGLRAPGVHERADGWVVARDEHLAAALSAPELSVAPAGPAHGPAAELLRRMARFSDAPEHQRRRALAEGLLPDPRTAEPAAVARTAALLRGRDSGFDLMPLARTVPVAVLATALGVGPAGVDRVVELVGTLCEALAPRTGLTSAPSVDPDAAAAELIRTFAPLVGRGDDEIAAAIGLLFQARDATAALIGSAAVAPVSAAVGDCNYWIEWAVRHEAPVQCTRRTARTDWPVDGVTVPAGADVWLVLAARECEQRDVPATFGAGTHGCIGAALAMALARGVVCTVHAEGWRAVPGQPLDFEPRPNLRLPRAVLMHRP